MALATRGPNFCKPDVVRHDWELARELDLNITVHVAMDRFGYTKMQVAALREMDLLYPNTTYIHASHFTPDEWALVRDSGGNVSFAPQIEIQMGHGWAPGYTATEHGIPIGLSSDVATTASADQFTQMHAIFGSERGRKHQEAWDAELDGLEASPGLITSRQVLRWATIDGAKVAGIADRTGSITPGKKADLVIIDGHAVNVAPIIDPVGAVVCAADISNVRTVLVDGEILKDDFRLTASLDAPRAAVEASKDYLLSKFGDPDPGWLPPVTAGVTA
jgi:cytosine/adenosine deaminase-related metal-dependent hydrolase